MSKNIFTVFTEKKEQFRNNALSLKEEIKNFLNIPADDLRIIQRYDVSGVSEELFNESCLKIFSEPNLDNLYKEEFIIPENYLYFSSEFLPGQFDQRADSAMQAIKLLDSLSSPKVKSSVIYMLKGNISENDFIKIKKYIINTVDSREGDPFGKYLPENEKNIPDDIKIFDGFILMSDESLSDLYNSLGLSMTSEDFKFIQSYFKSEKRNPTETEIKVFDTYWSDHCRHTTFNTKIKNIILNDSFLKERTEKDLSTYFSVKKELGRENRDVNLMELATIGAKYIKSKGLLDDLEESDEINACSIRASVENNGEKIPYLIMFKNETHNHPTEIEPFGGAATCLGGAIRDPLSGRSYVYQAMRITGAGNPFTSFENTPEGKLPQAKITKGAAHGYSSYGNQIGLATGLVKEFYHDGFVAKRMEIGAVIGCAEEANVVREKPVSGDIILMLGGKTGRDGIGGATGSSKKHDEKSVEKSGSEVQKGNAPEERKLQRLFSNPDFSKLVKKSNDFGAGGVSVAVGELADGLNIYLDRIPKKYDGLNATELAISESQERMAVVISENNLKNVMEIAGSENIECTHIADVTDEKRLRMFFNGETIVDIKREFLDTNGVTQETDAIIPFTDGTNYFEKRKNLSPENIFCDLNLQINKGLSEMFDSTIGKNTVLMPFGGKYQMTPEEVMAAKIPLKSSLSNTCTLMSAGYNPYMAEWSPFHGAYYAVTESVLKIVSKGGKSDKIRLSFQEYFEKPENSPVKWGKPLSALLGAFEMQMNLDVPSIGGKDSMSGTFKDMHVPPTLVSFAVNVCDSQNIISSELKKTDSVIYILKTPFENDFTLNVNELKNNISFLEENIKNKNILSSMTIGEGGAITALIKMSLGNRIGFTSCKNFDFFFPLYGSVLIETEKSCKINYKNLEKIAETNSSGEIVFGNYVFDFDYITEKFSSGLDGIFPSKTAENSMEKIISPDISESKRFNFRKTEKVLPNVFIPAFPGTNCENDSAFAFERLGAKTDVKIFRNLSQKNIEDSIQVFSKSINNANILMLPGGFSAGDEPEGSGKFIATFIRNPLISSSIEKFLERDGLILGICNGFQALIKTGLLPYGKITDINENSPTLSFNDIGRHVSCMVKTKFVSLNSPWLSGYNFGDTETVPVSHGEGKFICNNDLYLKLMNNNQIASQYIDNSGNPTYEFPFNPNGSYMAVEGIISPNGKIFGKMGHSERIYGSLYKNIDNISESKIFRNGINYFSV